MEVTVQSYLQISIREGFRTDRAHDCKRKRWIEGERLLRAVLIKK